MGTTTRIKCVQQIRTSPVNIFWTHKNVEKLRLKKQLCIDVKRQITVS